MAYLQGVQNEETREEGKLGRWEMGQGCEGQSRKQEKAFQKPVLRSEELQPERGLWGRTSSGLKAVGAEMSPPKAFSVNHLPILYCSSKTQRKWVEVKAELQRGLREG